IQWNKVVYAKGTFVAVGDGEVMTSPDGVVWTSRSAAEANNWWGLAYGNGKFVAVASDGTNRVMTSSDGATWTNSTTPLSRTWNGVAYGNGLFVTTAYSNNTIMTSPDGATWT